LVRNEDNLIRITRAKDKKILVVDFLLRKLSPVEDDIENKNLLVDFLKEEGLNVEHYTFLRGDDKIPLLKGIDMVIACSFDAIHNPYQAEIIRKLYATNVPIIVLSLCNPYDLQLFPEVSTLMTTYDYSSSNLEVACEVIVGKHIAQGILPVTLKF